MRRTVTIDQHRVNLETIMFEDLGRRGGGGGRGGRGGGGRRHGGHGHGHHHGHRRWRGGGGWWGGPTWGPATELVVVDDGCDERTLAYVLSLPKEQRAAAYLRLCGKVPPAGMLELGNMLDPNAPALSETAKWLAYSVAAVAGICLWRKYVRGL